MKHFPDFHNELLARFKARLQEGQAAIRERYLAEPDPALLLHQRSALIDEVLCSLWLEIGLPESLALVAVGGYGRSEMWPSSDVDLLLLLPAKPDQPLAETLEHLIGLFWDIGLKIGHSVRTVEECLSEAKNDLTVQTALVEARLLTGSRSLFESLENEFKASIDAQAFFHAKRMEQEERYLRFQESAYNLEPDCKESPGGLRDLQSILWIAQAAGFGASWQDLKSHGFITHQEQLGLENRERFLQRLRIELHLLVGRAEDTCYSTTRRRLPNGSVSCHCLTGAPANN